MIFNDDKRFEWDENKDVENFCKHGIRFVAARLAFNDPFLLKKYDGRHSLTENRYQILGRVRKILFVVYAEQRKQIRIISARLATKKEKEIYYGQNNQIGIEAWR